MKRLLLVGLVSALLLPTLAMADAKSDAEANANYWANYDWSKVVYSWSNSSSAWNRYGYFLP